MYHGVGVAVGSTVGVTVVVGTCPELVEGVGVASIAGVGVGTVNVGVGVTSTAGTLY